MRHKNIVGRYYTPHESKETTAIIHNQNISFYLKNVKIFKIKFIKLKYIFVLSNIDMCQTLHEKTVFMKKVRTSRKVRINIAAKRFKRRLRSKVKQAHKRGTGYRDATDET